MLSENRRGKLFARRVFIIGGAIGTLLLALISRLYYLQIIKADAYKTFSDSNRIKLFLVPSLRGHILDRHGRIMAGNKNYYRILFTPGSNYPANTSATLNKLISILKLGDAEHQKMLQKIANSPTGSPILLYDHLTWKQVAKVEVNSPILPGISIDVGQIRYYPSNNYACHMVGYLGPVPKKELKANPLLNHPDFRIGKSGLEKSMDSLLRGKVGVKRMEVNAFGLRVRELSREASLPGHNVQLTIDKRIQNFAGEKLNEKSGAAVVIDINTGGILSLCSSPGFNPNILSYGITSEHWSELRDNLDKPLINKALSHTYPPGSTFKMIVALAALEHGINPNMEVFCPGHVYLGSKKFHCWKEQGHGYLNMTHAIANSCNSYFYTISKKIGVDRITKIAQKFGLGETFDLDIYGQEAGLIPTAKWQKTHLKTAWHHGDTLNIGIGQGYVSTTPLQLSVMAARLASGRSVIPSLYSNPNNYEPELDSFKYLSIPPEHLNIVQKGMRNVVNMAGGTAYRSRIHHQKYSMAGKTGTAQVISKSLFKQFAKELSPDKLRYNKNHAIFVGYGPIDSPRYAASVVIEHGGSGSAAAAPVARDILHYVQSLEDNID